MKLAAALVLIALATPALASEQVPDGTYRCTAGDMLIGDVVISGETYQGPSTDGAFGEPQTFIVMGDRIEWLGTLGALDAAGTRIDHTVLRDGGFDMVLLMDGASDFTSASCNVAG